MFCQNCGRKIEETASFCPNCGCNVVKPPSDFPVTTKEDFVAEPLKEAGAAQPVVETASEVAQPIAEAAPVVETAPVAEAAPVVETAPVAETVNETASEVAQPVNETANEVAQPVVETPPVAEPAPVAQPANETANEVAQPVVETPPVAEAAPVVETAPVAEPAPVAQSVNETASEVAQQSIEVKAIVPPIDDEIVVSESFSSELGSANDIMAPTTDKSSASDFYDESAYPTSFPSEEDTAAGMLGNEVTEETAEFKEVTAHYQSPLEDMGITEVTANAVTEQVPINYSGKPSVGVMARPMSTSYGTTAKKVKTYKGAAITFGILSFLFLVGLVLETMLLFTVISTSATKDILTEIVSKTDSVETLPSESSEPSADTTISESTPAASETTASSEQTETTTPSETTTTELSVERDPVLQGIWSYIYNGETTIVIFTEDKLFDYYSMVTGIEDGCDYRTEDNVLYSDLYNNFSYRFVGSYLILTNDETLALTKIGDLSGSGDDKLDGVWYSADTDEYLLLGNDSYGCLDTDICSYTFDWQNLVLIGDGWELEVSYAVAGDTLSLFVDDGTFYSFTRIS